MCNGTVCPILACSGDDGDNFGETLGESKLLESGHQLGVLSRSEGHFPWQFFTISCSFFFKIERMIFGTFEGAINRLSAFEKQAMSKERERKQAANSSAAAAPHAAIPIIEMDSDHSDPAGEAGSHGSRTPSAGHTVGEAWAVDLHVA